MDQTHRTADTAVDMDQAHHMVVQTLMEANTDQVRHTVVVQDTTEFHMIVANMVTTPCMVIQDIEEVNMDHIHHMTVQNIMVINMDQAHHMVVIT